jgi:hypothetical protein
MCGIEWECEFDDAIVGYKYEREREKMCVCVCVCVRLSECVNIRYRNFYSSWTTRGLKRSAREKATGACSRMRFIAKERSGRTENTGTSSPNSKMKLRHAPQHHL